MGGAEPGAPGTSEHPRADRRVRSSPLDGRGVTRRETDVLVALAERLTNAEIAARLFVSERTVESHVASLLRKLHASNRLDLAAIGKDVAAAIVPSGFVGRERELGELEAGLRDVANGAGRLYLIVGEPGIGKSTLLDELATRAVARGFSTAWGRCWEAGGAPALWPWTQIVRAAAEITGADPTGLVAAPEDAESGSRFERFAVVVAALRSAASRRPLAVLLDDVHAADRASLLLLAFAAGELRDAGVLIAATYRDLEARRSPELAQMLAEVARWGKRLPLAGFDPAEVARLVTATAGSRQPDELVGRIHAATAGNPFFVDEIVRLHLARTSAGAEPDRVVIPDGVRDAIRATLAPIGPDGRRVLDAAAVLGRHFDPDIVADVCDMDADEALQSLRASGVIVDAERDEVAFSHALVRDTVYDDLRPGVRVQLHRRVGEVIEARPDEDLRSAELAYHFFKAAPGGGADKAVMYAKRAGDRAMDVLAYEDAASEYDRALKALGLCEPDEQRRCDLLVDLGQALLRAGEPFAANRALRAVADAARRLGDGERFASAVRHMSSEMPAGVVDHEEIRMVEEALDVMADDDSYARSSILGRLSRLIAATDPIRAGALADESVAMARRVGDPNSLVNALVYALGTAGGPDALDDRLSIAQEIVAVDGNLRDTFLGFCALTAIHLERADRAAMDEALGHVRTRAERLMQPRYTWQARVLEACVAVVDGRFTDADRLAREALEVGQRAHEPNVELVYGAHVAMSHNDQGRLPELESVLTGFAERYPSVPIWPAVTAVLHAAAGRPERARRELDRLDFGHLPRDASWLLTVIMAAEATAGTGDAERARDLYDRLGPYAGRIAMVASTAAYGPVDRYLGLLAATLGDTDGADRHFSAAATTCRHMHAPAWEAHVLHDHGRALLATDRERATRLLTEATEAYDALGLEQLARAAAVDLEAAARIETVATEAPTAVEARPVDAILQRDGSSWRVVFEGAEFRVRDSHGMRYLAFLLARPGLESHVLDLVSALRGGGESTVPSGDAGDAIDPEARAAYRARIEELRAEVSDAEDRGDGEGAARAQEEIDAIARELSSSLGLGGRSRKAASEAERARLNVSRAIRTAIAAIEGLSPSLGRYLGTTVRTGTFCSYTPDPRFPVTWAL